MYIYKLADIKTNIMNFEIPVLKNSTYDLSKFDFSIASIRILNIQSKEFKEYIKGLNPAFEKGNFSFFDLIIKNIHHDVDSRFAIVKDDYKQFSKQEIYNVHILLLILFPSGLQIENIVHFVEEKNFVQRSSMSSLETKYTTVDNYLYFDDDFLKEANEFINLVFTRIDYSNYIGLSIENYMNSFNVSHLHFSYIALCMSLENLINGNQELSYRLKRTTSILCGNTEENSNVIFKNLGKVYTLRSKIVHGENYTPQEIYTKIEYLQNLVSRALIELLIHNIPSNKDLDSITTTLGFGQQNKLSANWKLFKINVMTFHKIKSELI